jgi:hypothetical protein
MTTLDALQRIAQRHVLEAGTLPGSLATATLGDAPGRWGIYVEAYRLRLVSALAASYPTLAACLGETAFASLAHEYLEVHPSTFRSLRDFGAELAPMLAARSADAATRLQADLAAFEWTLASAFDAADVTALAVADLAGVEPDAWPGLTFAAVPSLGRLATTTNAVALWRAHREAREAGDGALPAAIEPTLTDRIEWLVSRPALETQFRSMPADEACALDALLAGRSFGSLCDALAADHGERAALVAATWLKGWLTEGLLLRV